MQPTARLQFFRGHDKQAVTKFHYLWNRSSIQGSDVLLFMQKNFKIKTIKKCRKQNVLFDTFESFFNKKFWLLRFPEIRSPKKKNQTRESSSDLRSEILKDFIFQTIWKSKVLGVMEIFLYRF